MIKMKTLVLLALITIAVIIGVIVQNEEVRTGGTGSDVVGQPLFPALAEKLNDIDSVTITSTNEIFTLTRGDQGWTIAEKADFPVDTAKLRQLLVGVAELKILEPKTSNPQLYKKLGLQDPTEQDAESTLVKLNAGDTNTIASIVLGKQRPSKANPGITEFYVRKPETAETWLVEGRLQLHKTARSVLDQQLLNLESNRIKQVTIAQPDGEQLVIRKETKDATDFTIVEPDSEKDVKSAFEVNNIANTLAKLSLDDVVALSDVDFSQNKGFTAELSTFEGLTVSLNTVQSNDETFATLSARVIEEEPADQEAIVEDNQESPTTPTDEPDAEDIRTEAATLNKRLGNWAFKIAPFHINSINKRAADLYTDEEDNGE